MTDFFHLKDKEWIARLLAIPALALILIAIICVAEARKPLYPAAFTGELLSVREGALEVEGYGLIPLSEGCDGFLEYESGSERSLGDLCVGSELEYETENDEICTIRETENSKDLPVRVLITGRNFDGCYHESVTLVCDGPLTASLNGTVLKEAEAGEKLTFNAGDEELLEGRIILTPKDDSGITVTSLTRAYGSPTYPGRLELLNTDEGLVLINETDLETYLTRVVPSEMAGYFDPEALKAQAVCARTYAYTQQRDNRYASYGAQLDDSTNYQVYNNADEEPRASAAVYDTAGELILYNEKPISAFYFSTSCGNTTDGSVWGMDTEDVPYLKSVALQPTRRTFDWSDEDEFASFIKRRDVNAYDSDSTYFRWHLTIGSDFLEQTFDDIGTITDVKVTRRGAGGIALEILITGTEGELSMEGQYAIRDALCDVSFSINRNDDSETSGFSALPSAFLYIEPSALQDAEGITLFDIYGGGYGHGAGMSQNGAQGMAVSGMDYREILEFFYEDVTVEDILRKD